MRICHLIYDDVANPWLGGGGAVRAREIYRRLAGRHQITLVTGRFPGAPHEEEQEGLRFVRVGSERSYALSRLGYCRDAVRILAGLEWDVWVHEFSAFAPLRVPARIRRQGILFFYHIVGRHALHKHPLVGWVSWAAEAWTLRQYRRIVTISPGVQQQVRERLGGRPAWVDCVYTGVDGRYFGLEPTEEPYLLYFGRADLHTKGLDLLVQAFARVAPQHPGVTLKMAGRGSPGQLAGLRSLVGQSGLGSQVQVLGGVGEEQKGELLRRALFVCMPSRYEGWGIAAVEAAACGKAVLGTRVSGLEDAVRHEQTGILVGPDSVEELARGMRRLLADAPLRRSLGAQGREWARRFDWERIALDQEAVYLRAAAENREG